MSLRVFPILCNAGFMNNYAYLLIDEKSGVSAVVDASEAAPIIKACEYHKVKPEFILVTHHHEDHTAANTELKSKYNLKIVAPRAEKDLIEGVDISVDDGDVFALGESKASIISAPGHTKGHILWYFAKDKALFTGDVLFNLSIGGLFEGTPKQMWDTLEKIKALPDDVRFYCGHEYTSFGLSGLPENGSGKEYFDMVKLLIEQNSPIVGIPLDLEKKCNPYLRVSSFEEFENLF